MTAWSNQTPSTYDVLDQTGFRTLKAAEFKPAAGPDDLALCDDGTYSDNTDLGDTCNSVGGVDEWLATYGECNDGRIIVIPALSDCCSRHRATRLSEFAGSPSE